MLLINSQGEYPRYIGDLQLEYPDYQEGDALPEGWHQVEETTTPQLTEPDTIIYEGTPVETDGAFKQTWVIRTMTAEEIERRDAPITLRAKLTALGLTEAEIQVLRRNAF